MRASAWRRSTREKIVHRRLHEVAKLRDLLLVLILLRVVYRLLRLLGDILRVMNVEVVMTMDIVRLFRIRYVWQWYRGDITLARSHHVIRRSLEAHISIGK